MYLSGGALGALGPRKTPAGGGPEILIFNLPEKNSREKKF
jgi:hypothetical protein